MTFHQEEHVQAGALDFRFGKGWIYGDFDAADYQPFGNRSKR